MTYAAAESAPRVGQGHLLFVGLGVMLIVNLWLARFETPPLVDWPNHLARHILQCGADGAANIAQYYEYALRIVPNLSAELFHTLPVACADPALTQKLLIQFSSFGVVAATVVLYRAIWSEWSVWPLVSGLIAHHMAWAFGFENFVLAVPFTLLALALWFRLERNGPLVTLLALWPVAVAIYVLHLYAFGFLMMALGSLELQRTLTETGQSRRVKQGLLSLGLLVVIAAGPALHLADAIANSAEIKPGETRFITFWGLIMTVLSPFGSVGNLLASERLIAIASGQFAVLVALPVTARLLGIDVQFDRRLRLPVVLLIGVTLLVPYTFADVAYTNVRFPILLAALIIAATHLRLSDRSSMLILGVTLAMFTAKVGWIGTHWSAHEAQIAELRAAATALESDDRLLVARDGLDNSVWLHTHSASYMLRDRGMYWAGLFTGGNSLAPTAAFAARDHTQPFPIQWTLLLSDDQTGPAAFASPHYLAAWEDFYTHVLILRPTGTMPTGADAFGPVIASGSFFDLHSLDISRASLGQDG